MKRFYLLVVCDKFNKKFSHFFIIVTQKLYSYSTL